MMKTVISSSTPSPCCESWNACAVPEKLAGDRRRQRLRARCCFTAVDRGAERRRSARRLNEIVTDASCPECATLSGPVAPLEVATSDSGTSLPLAPARRACSSAVASSCALGTVSITHPVLVGRRVDRRHLLLAVRVGERVLDRRAASRRAQRARSRSMWTVHHADSGSADRVVTPVSSGSRRCSRVASCCALAYSVAMSGPCSVNWYWLFEPRPPMRMLGGFWMKTCRPGMPLMPRVSSLHHLVGAAAAGPPA